MRVGLSKLLPNEKTVFSTQKVKKGDPIAAYGGWSWVSGDPLLPSDNSYQFGIPNTNKILDTKKGSARMPSKATSSTMD